MAKSSNTVKKSAGVALHEAISRVERHVVRIETPRGHGTGFLCPRPESESFLAIATARHVVAEADYWQQPIRVYHAASGEVLLLHDADRVMLHGGQGLDSSLLVIAPDKLEFPEAPIRLVPDKFPPPIGTDVGWVGYPQMYPGTCAFFPAGSVLVLLRGIPIFLMVLLSTALVADLWCTYSETAMCTWLDPSLPTP